MPSPHAFPRLDKMTGSDILKGVTCLLDGGHSFGDSAAFAGAHFVLSEHAEAVRVAHDEIRDGGVEPVVVFQYSEPLLQVETQQTDS